MQSQRGRRGPQGEVGPEGPIGPAGDAGPAGYPISSFSRISISQSIPNGTPTILTELTSEQYEAGTAMINVSASFGELQLPSRSSLRTAIVNSFNNQELSFVEVTDSYNDDFICISLNWTGVVQEGSIFNVVVTYINSSIGSDLVVLNSHRSILFFLS